MHPIVGRQDRDGGGRHDDEHRRDGVVKTEPRRGLVAGMQKSQPQGHEVPVPWRSYSTARLTTSPISRDKTSTNSHSSIPIIRGLRPGTIRWDMPGVSR